LRKRVIVLVVKDRWPTLKAFGCRMVTLARFAQTGYRIGGARQVADAKSVWLPYGNLSAPCANGLSYWW
jgi:hypothetical protein